MSRLKSAQRVVFPARPEVCDRYAFSAHMALSEHQFEEPSSPSSPSPRYRQSGREGPLNDHHLGHVRCTLRVHKCSGSAVRSTCREAFSAIISTHLSTLNHSPSRYRTYPPPDNGHRWSVSMGWVCVNSKSKCHWWIGHIPLTAEKLASCVRHCVWWCIRTGCLGAASMRPHRVDNLSSALSNCIPHFRNAMPV